MDLSRPHRAIAPTLEADALMVLARTTAPLTGRNVARLAGRGSQPAINQALERLVEQGLVHREPAGRAYLYRLNREHIAYPALEAIEGMRVLLVERLRDCIRSWKCAPVHCSMFGSAARGDGSTHSDIDLLMVRPGSIEAEDPSWVGQTDHLRSAVQSWTGNVASIIEVGEGDCRGLRKRNDAVVREVERDGIVLYGPSLTELLDATG